MLNLLLCANVENFNGQADVSLDWMLLDAWGLNSGIATQGQHELEASFMADEGRIVFD
jgi:hypothetical protein